MHYSRFVKTSQGAAGLSEKSYKFDFSRIKFLPLPSQRRQVSTNFVISSLGYNYVYNNVSSISTGT
jgi:hypothetical protein